MTRLHSVAAACAVLSFGAITTIAAGPTTAPVTQSQHAKLTLVSDATTVAPGTPFRVALFFQMDPEWHIYWREPGDSGMPPSVKWSLPDGFKATELAFPKPEALTTPAGTNYVHGGDVALLVEITPPADLAPGTDVTLAGAVRWLECDADRCLPAKGDVAITIKSAPTAAAADTDRFAAWQAKIDEGKSFKVGADAPAQP